MFSSLLVPGEPLTSAGRDMSSASVPCHYSGSDLGDAVDAKTDSLCPRGWDHRRDWSGLVSVYCLEEIIHRERAGSHSGLERLRSRRTDRFLLVLFGPRRDPRHCCRTLRSLGCPARLLIVQLRQRDDVQWKGRLS